MNMVRILAIGVSAFLISACASSNNGPSQMARERDACAYVGIVPGSPTFANCVGKLDQAMSADSNAVYH